MICQWQAVSYLRLPQGGGKIFDLRDTHKLKCRANPGQIIFLTPIGLFGIARSVQKRLNGNIFFSFLLKVYNAQQLKKWCLHFIATNHTAFEATALKKELELLVSQNKVYFEEHRWPPESCVTSLQNSKRRGALIPRCKPMGCSPYKCSVM